MRWYFLLVLGVMLLFGCGAGSSSNEAGEARVELAFEPSPPKVGPAEAILTLTDPSGQPIRGASVKLEGNMNHAGMEPVFVDAKETEPGKYRADLKFTMGGDWFVLVSAALADGRKVNRKIDVPGVKSR